jgi:hypothetical protein
VERVSRLPGRQKTWLIRRFAYHENQKSGGFQMVASNKKNTTKRNIKKVPPQKVFWCQDGQVFEDLGQLIIGFDLMSDETYLFHANDSKNDFSCWIADVIEDQPLAKKIKKARSKKEAKAIAESELAGYDDYN